VSAVLLESVEAFDQLICLGALYRVARRLDPAERRLLERAAEASQLSVSAFVLRSAVARAALVLAERPLIEPHPEIHRSLQRGASRSSHGEPLPRRSAVPSP